MLKEWCQLSQVKAPPLWIDGNQSKGIANGAKDFANVILKTTMDRPGLNVWSAFDSF
jgi:hypothetical protein